MAEESVEERVQGERAPAARVPEPAPSTGHRLLLVEDDDGDALLVEELLIDSGERYETKRVASIAEAHPLLGEVDCALVDLGLPDAHGLSALTELRAAAPDLAIVVFTGLSDLARAVDALAEGAQDYILKGQVDGPGLARAIRYAIERRRAQRGAAALAEAARREDENARLARGLLPVLQVDGPVTVRTRYRPGADALLGGDFFDVLRLADGRVRAVIGDVCGHGPAEAAVGVALRIAWRSLTLAGASEAETLAIMEQVLISERDEQEPFATVLDVTVDPARHHLAVRRHGHPPPLLVDPAPRWLDGGGGPPLGCFLEHVPAPVVEHELPAGWTLLLLTDGIFEGRAGDDRLGTDGLVDLVERRAAAGTPPEALLDALIADAQDLHGGHLEDDLALLWLLSAGA